MLHAQARAAAQPAPQNNRFPWTCQGVTFRNRSHLEGSIEQLATAGGKQHLAAARTLLAQAVKTGKLTSDQHSDLKKSLNL